MITPFETFPAVDGAVVRLRLPGGVVTPGTWTTLAEVAEEFGDGRLHLTARGKIQLRGIRDPEAVAGALGAAAVGGRHDVVASPLSPAARALARELQEALAEVELPRRTLIGVDGGDGDILGQRPDLGYRLQEGGLELVEDGVPRGLVVDEVRAGEVLAEIAGGGWPELERLPSPTPVPASVSGAPVGWLEQSDGLVGLGAGLRFGVLDARVARMLDVIGTQVSVTPWASLVIHDLEESVAEQVVRVLAPLGLIFDARSPWLRVTACVGAPACGHGVSEVRDDAARLAASGLGDDARVHFLGCGRGCGRPRGAHTEYRATGDGEYEVTEVPEARQR